MEKIVFAVAVLLPIVIVLLYAWFVQWKPLREQRRHNRKSLDSIQMLIEDAKKGSPTKPADSTHELSKHFDFNRHYEEEYHETQNVRDPETGILQRERVRKRRIV